MSTLAIAASSAFNGSAVAAPATSAAPTVTAAAVPVMATVASMYLPVAESTTAYLVLLDAVSV